MPKGHFKRSEDHKRHISEALKGRPKNDEVKAKISEAKKGTKQTTEQIEKRRQWMLANSPNRGKRFSEEHKAKLSASKIGKASSLVEYGIPREEYIRQVSSGNKWCCFRKHFAPKAQFSGNKRPCCDSCKTEYYRASDLAKKYNVDQQWYLDTLAAQGGVCAICGNGNSHPKRNKHMMIDHDHATGNVRGILCGPCNTAIERLETVKNWGILAAAYLAKY